MESRHVFGVLIGTLLLACSPVLAEFALQRAFPKVAGPYLGQPPPGGLPELFAPFLATPQDHKHSSPAFSPDGTEMYYSVYIDCEFPERIFATRLVDGVWTTPRLAQFSGTYQEGGPSFSRDGQRLYYGSKRPRPGDQHERDDRDIWYVEREGARWSEPQWCEFSSDSIDAGPSLASSGNIYFTRGLQQDRTRRAIVFDIHLAEKTAAGYARPQTLSLAVNSPDHTEGRPCISPDETFIVFSSFGRTPGARHELFVSFRDVGGNWSAAKSMGDMINRGGARFPKLSPDGKYLFFTSNRSGREEIYWVDASVIDFLQTGDLNLIDRLCATVLEAGAHEAQAQLSNLRGDYAEYYSFDGLLLDSVGDRLLVQGQVGAAEEVYLLNQDLFAADFGPVQAVKLAATTGDWESLAGMIAGLAAASSNPGSTVETDINRFGYLLLNADLVDAAVKVLRLNVDLFPESANVHDSYGEALLAHGDTTLAIRSYRRSLELDRGNENAKHILRDLGVDVGE